MSERPSYRLDRDLGRGMTSIVRHGVLSEPWLDLPAGTEVAVKELAPELSGDPRALAAFRLEAEAGSAATHPSLVRVVDSHVDAERAVTVMTFVPGRTLREVLEQDGPLAEPRLRSVGAQLSGALASLHAAGFTHGDVKPENVRLDEAWQAVLLDLGFARRVGEQGVAAASPAYAGPELLAGRTRTPESDVFALGVLLFELSTAELPFLGRRSPRAALGDDDLARLARARFRAPSRIAPRLSPFLDALLGDVLQREPARRPGAAELERRLVEGEAGGWWRARLELHATARRWSDAEHTLPMIGREVELARLLELYAERVRDVPAEEAGAFAWLVGEQGTGKSRLVGELAARARGSDDPPMFLYGRFAELEEDRPCQAVLRLLQRFLRLPSRTRPGPREREALEALVPPPVARTLLASMDAESAGATEVSVPVALVEWLTALGRESPLIVFLDDVHWAGQPSLELLSDLARRLPGSRLLVVLGWRENAELREPEAVRALAGALAEHGPPERIELGPLDEDAVRELVFQVFHPSVPRLHLADVLWRRTRGNPGFLTEILRGLERVGKLRSASDRDRRRLLTVPPDELPLPASLTRAIADAYRALPVPDQLWLRRLAVVGGRIRPDFLQRAFPGATPAEIEATLSRLVAAGWLVASGDRYRFARPAQREAVYRSLSDDARRALHRAAAEALRAEPGQGLPLDLAFQRAFHLRAAGEHAALLRLLKPLLSRTLERGQYARADSLARWGLEAVATLPPTRELDAARIELLEAAADASDSHGRRRMQRELLDQLSDLELDPENDAEMLGRVYLLHGRYAVSVGQYALARSMLHNAADLFRRSGSDTLLSDSLRRLASVQAHVGDSRAARQLADEACERAVGDVQLGRAMLVLSTVELLDGWLERGLRCVDQAQKLLRRGAPNTAVLAYAHMQRARIYRASGRPARALAAGQRAVRLAHRAGDRRLEAEASARLGGMLLDLDRGEEAEARLREAVRIAEEIEDRRGRVLAGVLLGVLLAEEDRDEEAEALLSRSVALARETGLTRIEAYGLSILARIARAASDLKRADELSRRALEQEESHGAELADQIVIVGTRALIEAELGDRDRAARRVRVLRQEMKQVNQRLRSPILRQRHRRASTRLLEAVLSPEGPILPRVRLALKDLS